VASIDDRQEQLLRQIEELRERAESAEAVLEALRAGEVDALVGVGPDGDRVFTLQGAEEPYRFAIEQMNEGAATLSADGTILYCNARLATMVGVPRETLIGSSFAALLTPDEAGSWGGLLAAGRAGACAAEFEAPGADGSGVPLRLALSPLPPAADAAVCLVAADMSEARAREAALKQSQARLRVANRELEAFAYSISHDLRAPLRAIDGFSEIIAQDYAEALDGAGLSHLRRVRAAAQKMGQLIDDLLALSRLNRQDLQVVDVDLTRLAEDVIARLREEGPDRRVHVTIAAGCRARGDAGLLEVVLINLLSNAWKFTSQKADARIKFGQTVIGNERVYCVRDNGVGFEQEYVTQLFAPFQRLHEGREFPGTGIGLATVSRVVTRHGGRCWAEGAVGEGAAFYFTLGTPAE
jgi:PAS domain S-box-containing protein